MKKLNSKGFSAVEGLLVLIVVGIIAGAGWYVWQARNNANSALDTANQTTSSIAKAKPTKKVEAVTDPTADWTSFTSAAGKYSLKYPKNWVTATNPSSCSEGILLVAPTVETVGKCGSEGFGEIAFVANDPAACTDEFTSPTYTDIKKEIVVVSTVQGQRQSSVYHDDGGAGLGHLPENSKVIAYCFNTPSKQITANYIQAPGNPDVASDFDLVVRKTLKFN
jgi:hypothetical protein